MLFNSIEFALFVPIVFMIYWLIPARRFKLQNVLILGASYVFYGWWDWRFLGLIIISSGLDYVVGLGLGNTLEDRKRKWLLGMSVVGNLGMLGFFKYFNFFSENFAEAFTLLGMPIDPITLELILPVGISFYTFQTLSYTLDIYHRRLKPTEDIVAFFAFVGFFPQLVAGPIERARDLLPQFFKARSFDPDKAIDGLRQILWGLFNKVVIADNCAGYVNQVYGHHLEASGSSLFLAAILFSFQIYCDFSGYSHIAIGTARLFGFHLTRNFAYPFFATNFADFWTRWHISLTSWFRDYLYFPLRKTRLGRVLTTRTVFISFGLIGFWHGPSWNFVIWGLINACFLLIFRQKKKQQKSYPLLPAIREIFQMGYIFVLTTLAAIFFRVQDLHEAMDIFAHIFSPSFFTFPESFPIRNILFILGFTVAEWLNRARLHSLDFSGRHIPQLVRWIMYYFLIYQVIWWGVVQDRQAFIYFQF